MVDLHMMNVAHLNIILGFERVVINKTVERYFFLDERQNALFVLGTMGGKTFTPLKQTKHGYPGCSSTPLAFQT